MNDNGYLDQNPSRRVEKPNPIKKFEIGLFSTVKKKMKTEKSNVLSPDSAILNESSQIPMNRDSPGRFDSPKRKNTFEAVTNPFEEYPHQEIQNKFEPEKKSIILIENNSASSSKLEPELKQFKAIEAQYKTYHPNEEDQHAFTVSQIPNQEIESSNFDYGYAMHLQYGSVEHPDPQLGEEKDVKRSQKGNAEFATHKKEFGLRSREKNS